MNKAALWRVLTLGGLLGLIGLILVWNLWLRPVQQVPLWLEFGFLITPLLLLLPGILRGNSKTHVYAVLVSLLYVTLGIWVVIDPLEKVYGYALIGLSICLYAGGFMSAKLLGKKA